MVLGPQVSFSCYSLDLIKLQLAVGIVAAGEEFSLWNHTALGFDLGSTTFCVTLSKSEALFQYFHL